MRKERCGDSRAQVFRNDHQKVCESYFVWHFERQNPNETLLHPVHKTNQEQARSQFHLENEVMVKSKLSFFYDKTKKT